MVIYELSAQRADQEHKKFPTIEPFLLLSPFLSPVADPTGVFFFHDHLLTLSTHAILGRYAATQSNMKFRKPQTTATKRS